MSTASGPRRDGALWPFAVAAAVFVVAIAAAVLLTRGNHAKDVATACPKTYPLGTSEWVPAKAQTSDPGKALVPEGTPQRAVICAYRHSTSAAASATTVALTGAKDLHGNPDAVVAALRAVRPATSTSIMCENYRAETDRDAYLLAMSYDGEVVWVSMPGNHCQGTGNGAFEGDTNLRPDAAQAYSYGIWPTDESLTGQCDRAPADNGVTKPPTDATGVTVCLRRADGKTHAYRYGNLGTDTAGVITSALRAPSAKPGTSCPATSSALTRVQLHSQSQPDFVLLGTSSCLLASGNLIITGAQAAAVQNAIVDLVDRT